MPDLQDMDINVAAGVISLRQCRPFFMVEEPVRETLRFPDVQGHPSSELILAASENIYASDLGHFVPVDIGFVDPKFAGLSLAGLPFERLRVDVRFQILPGEM